MSRVYNRCRCTPSPKLYPAHPQFITSTYVDAYDYHIKVICMRTIYVSANTGYTQ